MEELAQLSNASASYDDIASMGPPAAPLAFPDPVLGIAARVTAIVFSPESGTEIMADNVIYKVNPASQNELPNHAYLIGRKLKRAIYGCVRAASVLRLRDRDRRVWEMTNELSAVKIIEWNAVRQMKGRQMEDPVKEVACMQHISKDGLDLHPNVLGTLDVLADEQYMYSFMPFCTGGEMFAYVEKEGRFPEPLARYWFKQILQVSWCVVFNCLLFSCCDALLINFCASIPFASYP